MHLPVPHIDADGMTLGPATRLFYAQGDAFGRVRYRVERRGERLINLGKHKADTVWAVFDQILFAAFFRPETNELGALADYSRESSRTWLFGDQWGKMTTEEGETTLRDPWEPMRRAELPVALGEREDWLCLRFNMNVHYRELFSREVLRLVDMQKTNTMEMFFELPAGRFVEARLIVQDRQSYRRNKTHTLHNFPLRWHDAPGALRPDTREEDAIEIPEVTRISKPTPPPREPVAPLPDTASLEINETLSLIGKEDDADRRWRMVLQNLQSGEPARVYHMLARHGSLVAEHTEDMHRDAVIGMLAGQPAALLMPVAMSWSVENVLELAEKSPDKEWFMGWLREREVERLLAMDLDSALETKEQAREWLGIRRRHPNTQGVRRIWRTLLGFMRSDFGRRTEMPIHKRKDEIAKRLQRARDLLLDK